MLLFGFKGDMQKLDLGQQLVRLQYVLGDKEVAGVIEQTLSSNRCVSIDNSLRLTKHRQQYNSLIKDS